jgi:Peptidase family M48
MILLSSEEEDEIASQLAGSGWFKYVGEILAREGSLKIIPSNDWRYEWVRDTLRKLETSIPVLASEPELTTESGSNHRPQPPPAQYPLRPRPRASEYLHHYCSKLCNNPVTPNPTTPGPPYSLLVVDKPELSNAFSYGFGPDGGSGIVVYSGFLDDIFSKMPPQYGTAPPQKQSLLSKFFGGIFSSSPSLPPHPIPTEEQTAELAILLAHEMAHLILCHHLESLSSVTVIVPGTLSIASDVIRVLIFPFTMLFGPFVNDAVAQLGKVGSLELAKISEHCTNTKQEIEADVVSARQVFLYLRNKFLRIKFLILLFI